MTILLRVVYECAVITLGGEKVAAIIIVCLSIIAIFGGLDWIGPEWCL